MIPLYLYKFSFKFVGVEEWINWVLEATEEEISILCDIQNSNPIIERVEYCKLSDADDEGEKITHQFDSEGNLWCLTDIKI